MNREEFTVKCKEAKSLRESFKYEEAELIYNELVNYVRENDLSVEDYSILNLFSGLANCKRKKFEKNFPPKKEIKDKQLLERYHIDEYKCSIDARNFINHTIKEYKKIDVHNKGWFRTELIWSYLNSYLSEEYKSINKAGKAILACNKLLDINIQDDSIAYRTFKHKINQILNNTAILETFPDEMFSLLSKISSNSYFRDEYKYSLLPKNHFNRNNKNLSAEQKFNIHIENQFLVAKLKILYFKEEYNEIIRVRNIIFDSGDICDVPISVERLTAKAYSRLGDVDKAVESIENAIAEHNHQFYFYKDIAEIYEYHNNIDNAILNYYKYCIEVKNKNIINNVLLKLIELIDNEELAKKHLTLYFLIQEREGWGIKPDIQNLKTKYGIESLGISYEEALKEFIDERNEYIAVHDEIDIYGGVVDKIGENGRYGFIKYNYDDVSLEYKDSVYFKIKKNMEIKKDYYVDFTIEKSYDRSKNKYSLAANILNYEPPHEYPDDDYFYDNDYYDPETARIRSRYSDVLSIADEMGLPDDEDILSNLENLFDR